MNTDISGESRGCISGGFKRLVLDYQKAIIEALVLMQRSGIQMPNSAYGWVYAEIPMSGELEGGGHYYKHGVGCDVRGSGKSVDFDFGNNGEVGGFDAWWLAKFAGENLRGYGFDTAGALDEYVDLLISAGDLTQTSDGLCFVSGVKPLYAVDVDGRRAGDILPLKGKDPILILHAQQFQAADLMRKNYGKIIEKLKKRDRLSLNEKINARIYLSTWLGFLRVTCEGFFTLQIRRLLREERPEEFGEIVAQHDAVLKLEKQHRDALRELRNNTFHPQRDVQARREFFDSEKSRIQWAHELHNEVARFFSSYRIQCESHYFVQGRLSELDIRRNRVRRRKEALS
ncbi:DUF6896 domain-containing protein [Burkholderia ambifaria]|uniref:DUF6896 domain-containing protein n=1 Tax=Burkholderia ambifaria TaxID=152480 RepID=UPI001B92264A|nr:hypothetical protein [Burkholderia ambifaria]MBR8253299.1 hypothetical protein [Burkholderia ambifaria]